LVAIILKWSISLGGELVLGFGYYRGRGVQTRTRVVWAEVPTKKQILQTLSSILTGIKHLSDISDSEYDPEDGVLVKYELLMIKGWYQGIPVRIVCDEALPGFSCTVWVAGKAWIRRDCRPFPEDIVQAVEEVVNLYRRIYGDTPVTSEPGDWREYWEEEEEEDYCDPYDPLAPLSCWLNEEGEDNA
jgi:hypothetical protein